MEYCQQQKLSFTRSRPYRKNDNCFVEQKNYSIVRRAVGYQRYDTEAQLHLLNASVALSSASAPVTLAQSREPDTNYHRFCAPIWSGFLAEAIGRRLTGVTEHGLESQIKIPGLKFVGINRLACRIFALAG